jgi:hypothetical protein
MRGLGRLHRIVGVVSFALAFAVLGGCAAPATSTAQQADAGTAPASDSTAQPPAQEVPAAPKRPVRTGGPLPPERIDRPAAIDTTCRTDADCVVKDVGNCCGYYPACVNATSPTDPKGVQAECAKKGLASVCGFREISSCTCSQGHCEGASGGMQVR